MQTKYIISALLSRQKINIQTYSFLGNKLEAMYLLYYFSFTILIILYFKSIEIYIWSIDDTLYCKGSRWTL